MRNALMMLAGVAVLLAGCQPPSLVPAADELAATRVLSYEAQPSADEIDARLDRVLDEVRFDGVPLEYVMADLGARAGVYSVRSWGWAEQLLIRKRREITLHLRDAKVRDVLTAALDQAAGRDVLTFQAADGVVLVFVR